MDMRQNIPMGGFQVLTGRTPANHILPFLWIHGEDEATYRKMVRVIHGANISAFCIEARPHPDFCGDGWWRDLEILLDEAEKWKMKVWILDDKHFPTGSAGGALQHAPLSLRRRHITHRSIPVSEGQKVWLSVPGAIRPCEVYDELRLNILREANDGQLPLPVNRDALLCCAAYGPKECLDLSGKIEEDHLSWTVPAGITTIEFCGLTYDSGFHRSYINMLDADSCRVLIDAVYEPHYAHFAEKFGSVIAGFFSDEPELGNGDFTTHYNVLGTEQTLPYSEALAGELEEVLGKTWRLLLPLLWIEGEDLAQTARVRYHYMDCVSRLVQHCFSEPVGDWCRAHGVQYIGHVIEDNNQHARTSTSLGHYFRCQRGQDMSGIDDIGGQVMPGGEDKRDPNIFGSVNDGEFYHYALGKLGGSAAAITPRMQGRAMCELFGNYGWGEGVRLEKYLTDHFLVRGIRYFVPHAFTCSPYPDPDCPPHFYAQGNHPQYRHFGQLMAYTNRLADLLSEGRTETPAAILYHGEGEWCGEAMLMQKPARVLADHQIDYLFLPSDVFSETESYRTRVGEEFSVNGQVFQILIVPYMRFLPREAAEAIARMPERTIFLEALPDGTCTGEPLPEALADCPVVPLADLAEFLCGRITGQAEIIPADDRIRICHITGEREGFFLVNEGQKTYRGELTLAEETPYGIYDAWTDQIWGADQRGRRVAIELAPSESLLLLRSVRGETQRRPAGPGQDLTEFLCSTCRAIDYPRFQNPHRVRLPHDFSQEDPRFSGFLRYETTLGPEVSGPRMLGITEAGECAEVFLNGRSLGLQVIPPFCYDLTPYLTDGMDLLVIEIATTPERELVCAPGAAPTGLTGRVILYE